jgi:uncharacterized protein (TIGR03067 family)
MAESWHVAKAKTKLGPFSREQLKQLARSGQLLPSDMVLPAGTGKWVSASTVDGVFGSLKLPPTADPKRRTDGTEARAMVSTRQPRPHPAPKPEAVRPPAKRSVRKAVVVGCAALAVLGCLVTSSASVAYYYWFIAARAPNADNPIVALRAAAADTPEPPPVAPPAPKPEPPPVAPPAPKPEPPPVAPPKADPPDPEQGGAAEQGNGKSADKLDGKWFVARQEERGGLVPPIVSQRLSMVIDGNKMEWYIGNPAPNFVATITLDEAKKTVDAKITRGSFIGKTMLGIYKFEKDQLHMCWGEIGTDKRPEKYASTKPGGGAFNYTVYSRKPAEKNAPPDVAKKDPPDKKPPPTGQPPKLADLKLILPKGWDAKYSNAVWRISYKGFTPDIQAIWMVSRNYPKDLDDLVKRMQNDDYFANGMYLASATDKGKLPDGLYVVGKFKMGKDGKESKYNGFAIIREFGGEKLKFESFSTSYDDPRLLKEAMDICKSAKF